MTEMLVNFCLLALCLQAKPSLLMNGSFDKDLVGWTVEGAAHVANKTLTLGPGKAAIRQRYEVPGLRILYFGATLKPSEQSVASQVRLQCFDKKSHLLMDLTAKPDAKSSAGIYMKTQAHTAYVVLSIEKTTEGGTVAATDLSFADDDKDRVEHAPQIDLDAYMKPIWEGDTVLNESVLLLSTGGSAATGTLMFQPSKVLAVKDPGLGTTYVEGKDFHVEGRHLVAVKRSSIPTMSDTEFVKGEFPWTRLDGRHVFVTYQHQDAWKGPLPEYQGDRLPETISKLKSQKPLTVVAFGDSITLGINVSGYRNVPPYMPPWPDLFAHDLAKRYRDDKVKLYNMGLGGMTAAWARDNARDGVASLDPDLVLIAFGMNDFWSTTPDEYRTYIADTMRAIRERCPKCEFLLIAPMKFDPAYTADPTYVGHLAGYAGELRKLTGPGVALFDMTALSEALYQAKSQKDLATDPMHPDDFLARWYAQGAIAVLTKGD